MLPPILKMEAAYFFEILVYNQKTTRYNNAEDSEQIWYVTHEK
jgi:hypothetical protein